MSRKLILVALLVVMTRGLARADDDGPSVVARTIAVLSLQISGDAAPELRAQVQESLRLGLDAVGFVLVPRERVTAVMAAAPDLTDCTSATCLQQIGDAIGASQFVRAQVEAAGAAYTIRLELLAPDVEGQVKRRVEDSCAVCTIADLSDLIRGAAGELVAAQRQPVPVVVITRPEGASLTIDGRDVGASPFKGELDPGSHQITALLPGHLEAEQTIAVTGPGQTVARFEIILSPTATTEPIPPPPVGRFRIWKWAAAGGAAASLITGIAMIAVDGNGTCSAGDAECENRYATMAPGVVCVVIGLGLGGASGWMFISDQRATSGPREPGPLPTLTPTRGGAVAGVSVRF